MSAIHNREILEIENELAKNEESNTYQFKHNFSMSCTLYA